MQDLPLGRQEGGEEARLRTRADVGGDDALEEFCGVEAVEEEEAAGCEFCGAGGRGWWWEGLGGIAVGAGAEGGAGEAA